MSQITFPDVKVRLVGEDGNAFNIIGRVSLALCRAGYHDAAEQFVKDASNSKSYDDLLGLALRTVDVY
jgi:hypothetical protein